MRNSDAGGMRRNSVLEIPECWTPANWRRDGDIAPYLLRVVCESRAAYAESDRLVCRGGTMRSATSLRRWLRTDAGEHLAHGEFDDADEGVSRAIINEGTVALCDDAGGKDDVGNK